MEAPGRECGIGKVFSMQTQDLASRLFHNQIAALELGAIYLGERLGLYRSLADAGPATSSELAARTGTTERYIREWLEHHAASGLLDVDDPRAAADQRRYVLPKDHIPVLADRDHVAYGALVSIDIARSVRRLPDIVDAFRSGSAPPSLPWEPEGRAGGNRSRFLNLLGKQWLPAMQEVDARLRAEPAARVADLACGLGWSSIAMALAYPNIFVDGLDLDKDAIRAAQRNASEAGLADRVTFSATDAAQLSGTKRYDLVTIIEALHDMARPVEALQAARALLDDDGAVLVIDFAVQEEFTAPASDLERYEYGWSLLSCLPNAMGDPQTAATGTVMRPATFRRYAHEAGFSDVKVLPVETDYWRFYQLSQ